MKTSLTFMLMLAGYALVAQTQINKSIPVQAGQRIEMHFDYPKLVKVSTWDKNEISIQGTVSINSGESDDAFELSTESGSGVVRVSNQIHNLKSLPHRITITRDGQKISFKSEADYQKYANENGKSYNMMSNGVDIEVYLEVKVPKNMATKIEAVYGMVEIRQFNGPLVVDATYGGVDAALTERSMGELTAETNYGQIYTNLEIKFSPDNIRQEDFHTFVSAKPGTGPKYAFESKYGNVYLRKAM